MQTNEGEKISQLIAGYIDIILKKVTVLIFFFIPALPRIYEKKTTIRTNQKIKTNYTNLVMPLLLL